jgi:hypothetical protein
MNRSAILLTALVAGCSRPAPPSIDPPAAAATVEPVTTTPTPAAPDAHFTPVSATIPATQPTPAAPTEFAFPPDLAGQQLPRVVAPKAPPLPQTEKFGQTPLARTPSAKLLDPDSSRPVVFAPAPVMLPKSAGLKPYSPAEHVPAEIGYGADAVPAKPTFPAGPGITTRIRDVALPPDLPILGRPVPDRASLDDPTADTGNAAIVEKSNTPALPPSAFVRTGLPDPFELADQVKPKVPPTADPVVVPVVLSPARVK